MDLYTDCPDCDGKGYDAGTMTCTRCKLTGIVPVRVKALEWDDMLSATPFDGSTYDIYASDTRTDVFDAEHSYGGDIGTFSSLDAAKAACQAHHERMVMAMLEVT